ncbi:MAG: cyclic-di-AMP phosphodiesterase PgpH [Pyrinomonadaceae bacterium]|jgi:putative nucleotidyltransferase with HDIG domain|nr:cyclic-di-AMP phosphodiesterase PgpH [Pyrinomonadaceae bacterium]
MAIRPRFTTPLSRARDAALQYFLRPFRQFKPRTRFMLGFSFLVAITTLLLISNYSSGFSPDYHEGEVIRSNVIARGDINSIDIAETERRRNAARQSTRPIFNFDSSRGESSARSFRAAWEDLKNQAQAKPVGELAWNGNGGAGVARAIAAHKFNENDLNQLASMIRAVGDKYIYDDDEAERLNQEIVLVDVRNPAEQMIVPSPRTRMQSQSAARQELELKVLGLPGWSQEERSALIAAVLPLIRPNLVLDQTATATAREANADKIPPVAISLKRNQVIAREGDTVTPAMLAQLAAIKTSGHSGRPWHNLLGLLAIVFAVYWAVWKFTEHRSTVVLSLSETRAFALVGSAIVVETALLRVGFTLADSVANGMKTAPFNDPTFWNFAIPFAAASLLVVMLVDTQLAFLAGLVTALFAGMLAPTGIQQSLYAMISCAAAVYGIGRYRERQSVTLAGLFVGIVNAAMAIALIAYAEQPFTPNTILLAAGCGFVGGLLTAIFAAGGLPINESLFGILTDVKLLELSNADLPVLGQLALRAPGTNQHSHAVGQLAEDACRAVGANPLLARIGALYHDIGKVAAPEYFVENQLGKNPHDHMRPSQSARIITSHVTYGMKLAKEINLPRKIADFIPQHHGTRTLHFFLRKAQGEAKPGEVIDEKDFRYPGPKPQFKEAAIMMLADSCEAAARSLARPDPENIRIIVLRIVEAVINDGQLDECDLTLQEITTIREAMISALTAIYHARIDYPGFNPPNLIGPLPKLPSGELDSEERGISYHKTSDIPINEAGEVEDEAISREVAKR